MFLLIREILTQATIPIEFTFQYVSINSVMAVPDLKKQINLHSNMFLLILRPVNNTVTGIENLHSNMFLLIRVEHSNAGFSVQIYIPICFY